MGMLKTYSLLLVMLFSGYLVACGGGGLVEEAGCLNRLHR